MSDITQPTPEATAGANRRLVLKTSLATLAALGAGSITTPASAAAVTDADILNFALNLEYLEAEFYLRAVYGTGLTPDETKGTGNQGKVTGGSMVPFKSKAIAQFASEIARDEQNHVDFLRGALGSAAIAEPTIDLKTSFNTLAKAAGIGDNFDPFADQDSFLLGAFIFEDVGVTAYHGASTMISNKSYLGPAAGILAVEAYHAGIIRTLVYQAGGLISVASKISALRDKLSRAAGSPSDTDQGLMMNGTANLVPANSSSVAFARTPAPVLNIVYAGGSSGNFGFFPNRVNGNIQ
jgi:hypothetical protein